MNDVIISAILKGDFEDVSNDGVQFTLVSRGSKSSNHLDEFTLLAYGNSAKFLKQHATSGNRIVAQGRLSSEKLNTDAFHTAITANRVLSISDASGGIDYTRALVSGIAKCEGILEVGNQNKPIAPFNIQNERRYVSRDGEERVYTTYLSATLWGDRAVELRNEGLIPMEGENVTVEGILKPRTYTNREGQEVSKVDIWIDDLIFAQAQSSPSPRPRRNASDSSGSDDDNEEASSPPASGRSSMRDASSSPF